MPVIVLVEDNVDALESLGTLLELDLRDGLCKKFQDGPDFLRWWEQPYNQADLYIFGVGLPSVSGLDLISIVRSQDRDTPIVMCSGQSDRATVDKALARGANRYYVKPVTWDEFVRDLEDLLTNQQPRLGTDVE